jgi:glycine oxidase
MPTFDVIVVGGGIVGLASAHALAGRGLAVAVLDQRAVGKEASWAGGGILFPLLPWHYPPDYAAWVIESAKSYAGICQRLQAESGMDAEYGAPGMILLQTEMPQGVAGIAAETCLFCGQEALFLPGVAQVRNPRLLAALKTACVRQGVVFFEHEPVLSCVRRGDAIDAIKTPHFHLQAGQYLICAGAWSGLLLEPALVPLRVVPVRGQMLLLAFEEPPFAAMVFGGHGIYAVPRRDGHVLLGSTLEANRFNPLPTAEGYDFLLEQARRLGLNLPEASIMAHWGGLRPALENRLWPVIDRHPDIENLFVNTGHFRYGLTTAFSSAAQVVGLLAGQQTGLPFRWPAESAGQQGD